MRRWHVNCAVNNGCFSKVMPPPCPPFVGHLFFVSLRVIRCIVGILGRAGEAERYNAMSGNLRRTDYPPYWGSLRVQVLARDDGRCACRGECGSNHCRSQSPKGLCGVPNYTTIIRDPTFPARWWLAEEAPTSHLASHERKEVKVILTIAHLCQDSLCDNLDHLRAFCQRCHLVFDQRQHTRNAAATLKRQKEAQGQLSFF